MNQWWIDESCLPDESWAELNIFVDNTASVRFVSYSDGKLYLFDDFESARNFLLEEEFRCFDSMDELDEIEHGIKLADLSPPSTNSLQTKEILKMGKY